MEHRCIFAGFGGQGILSMGTLLAYAGMCDGKQVTFFPSYGIAMRGGTANCSVVVAGGDIASPIVNDPDVVIAMNEPSFDCFQPMVAPGGLLLVNSSLVHKKIARPDIRGAYLPATGIALESGDGRMANMAMLGALVRLTDLVSLAAVDEAMRKTFSAKLQKLIGKSREVLQLGFDKVEQGP